MANLFLRLYLLLFLSLVVSAAGLDYLYNRFHRDTSAEILVEQALWQHWTTAETRGNWQHRDALRWPDPLWQQLQRDRSLVLTDDSGREFFYGLHPDNERVLALALPSNQADQRHWYWLLAYYGSVALVIFLWLKPLVRDIDRLRQSVQQLRLPTEEMVVPVQQRSALTPVATALRDLRRHTVELMALQRDISEAVSHDIRTPLARIRFALAMLPNDAASERSRGIQADLQEIEQLVDEMLRYAQFEHALPRLQRQTLDLASFVSGVVARYQHQSVRISIDVPAGVTVDFDSMCLQRALQNLIDNALRYAGHQIRIGWRTDAGQRQLVVEDDGPGIDERRGDDLAKPFVTEGNAAGYGLGLAIVKKICLWHDGELRISRSTDLGGACVALCCFG